MQAFSRRAPRAPFVRSWLAAAALAAVLPLAAASDGGGRADELVVQLATGVDAAAFAAARKLVPLDQFGSRPIWRLRLGAPGDVEAVAAALQGQPEVVFAEPNFDGQTPEGERGNSLWLIGNSEGEYRGQWVPQAMRLPQAHQVSTGRRIRVAVLDTGVELNHPTIAPRLLRWRDGSLVGRDLVDDDAVPAEEGAYGDTGYGHGTHVAGLVALAAPQAWLMPVRVLDAQGRGNLWVLAEGLAWAADPDGRPRSDDGAHVINLSLGTTRPTRLLDAVVKLVTCQAFDDDDDDDFADPGFSADRERCRRGQAAVVVASAGNGGSADERVYPAAEGVEGSRAVAASTIERRLADFSNSGGWIGVAAPGASVISSVPGQGWGVWSGTSMAAPLAAGTAALVLATRAPGAQRANPRAWTPEQVVKRLEDRSAKLCDASLRQVDARAAVTDTSAPDPACP